MLVKCPKCMQLLEVIPGTTARCATCGYTAAVPDGVPRAAHMGAGPQQHAPAPHAAHHEPNHAPHIVTSTTVSVGLFLNLVIPGVGTLYTGRHLEGGLQLALAVFGLLTIFFLIGLAFLAGAYVWAIAGSIMQLVDLRNAPPYRS